MHNAAHIAVFVITFGLIATSTIVAYGHNRRRALIPVKSR